MDENIKIGFIGFGNMASAMAKGLLAAKVCSKGKIYACARRFDRLKETADAMGICPMPKAEDVVKNADYIIIAVKPHQIEEVITPIADLLSDKVVISVAAGYDFDKYEKILKKGTSHISTIPNTPIAICEGILICEEKHSLSPEEFARFKEIFGQIALIELVNTGLLSIGGTLGGCTPAFTAMYLEALADAGVKHGLSRPSAYRIAAKMLCGTGRLYLENEEHPGIMKDAVCSPGGTTICGVAALEKGGFRGLVIEAIDTIEE